MYDYENSWNIILINGCVIWAYVLLMLLGIAWIIIVDITFIARFLHASKAKKVTTFEIVNNSLHFFLKDV